MCVDVECSIRVHRLRMRGSELSQNMASIWRFALRSDNQVNALTSF